MFSSRRSSRLRRGLAAAALVGFAVVRPVPGAAEPDHSIAGIIQADCSATLDDDASLAAQTWRLRRVRPDVRGSLTDTLRYRVMLDVAGSQLALLDAYLDLRWRPEATLRIGKAKSPFGLGRLAGATALPFLERGLPTLISPNRDVGVQLIGTIGKGLLEYQLAALNGSADGGSNDQNPDHSFEGVARVFSHPLIGHSSPWLRGLGLGGAASAGQRQGSPSQPALPHWRSVGGQTIFRYLAAGADGAGVLADGLQSRFTLQGYYYGGPVGLQGEYVWSRHRVRLDDRRRAFDHQSWQVFATVLVTGEDATFRRVAPRRAIGDGGPGAIELGARYGELDVDADVFTTGVSDPATSATKAQALTLGVTWYLDAIFKAQLNYERTAFTAGHDRPSEHTLLARVEAAF
jgi:phosphate-selective porin OprO and OprP